MVIEADERVLAKRRLILRDSLGLLTLVVVTLVLFGVTLLLFRSFTAHRQELAERWSQRGIDAMRQGKPDQAVVALRTALTYAPETQQYELLLAQALGEAGHIDESYNYFMGLWERQPGNGFINLELARLAARRSERNAAIEFYRASIYGTWEGDGVSRRSQVRLELARYLIAGHEYAQARMELLITGGNTPESAPFDQTIGDLLVQAEDPSDAMNFYQKGLAFEPRNQALLRAAGELAYRQAAYDTARRLLERAVAVRAEDHQPPDPALEQMEDNAARLTELLPSPSLPLSVRADRVLEDRRIAKKRLDACTATIDAAGGAVPAIEDLVIRWASPEGAANLTALRNDITQQDTTLQLIYDTEQTTQLYCAPATGDDALLLQLANQASPPPQPEPQTLQQQLPTKPVRKK